MTKKGITLIVERACVECLGLGYIHTGRRMTAQCPKCDGKGKTIDEVPWREYYQGTPKSQEEKPFEF